MLTEKQNSWEMQRLRQREEKRQELLASGFPDETASAMAMFLTSGFGNDVRGEAEFAKEKTKAALANTRLKYLMD